MIAALLVLVPASAQAATITVDSTGDVAADDGSCVMREAIRAANDNAASGAQAGECPAGEALPAVDTIDFSIAGGGPHVIAPTGPLPEPHESATIDGGLTDLHRIVLSGVNSTDAYGLSLQAPGGHTVRRLAVVNFDRDGIETGFGAPGNTIELNRIGTNFAGDPGLGNETGIQLNGDGNTVRDNVISGNGVASGIGDGIFIFTGEANTIAGNRIGTDQAGTTALPNHAGITTLQDSGNLIGGPDPADANLISGNVSDGIDALQSSSLRVVGNLIGTDVTGTAALGNGGFGVRIDGSGAVIGTAAPGEGNVISGNALAGVNANASGTSVDGNRIGTTEAGNGVIPNGSVGVQVGAGDVTVGSSAGGNQISGHDGPTDAGVLVSSANHGVAISGVVIEGNRIGTAADGSSPLSNLDGIRVAGTTDGLRIVDNLVSGNDDNGIELSETSPRTVTGTVVQGNNVGNALNGVALGNGGHALSVVEADGTLVGGTLAPEGNALSWSGGDGVSIGSDAGDTALLGNRINVNDELGIDLEGGSEDGFGVTANDADDPDAGPNGLQNHPVIEHAVAGSQTVVAGSLDSTPDADFRIELFRSPAADPSGHGEGLTPLGSVEVATDGDGDARFNLTDLDATSVGDPVTATATALDSAGEPLRTSEYAANAIASGCDISGTASSETLPGTPADEVICGLEGDDVIVPGGGDDVIVGGAGRDEIDLSAAPDAVELDLEAGTATVGADSLLVIEVEDATGGDHADTLTGDGADNLLAGGSGADTLSGGGSADTLKGGDGADTLEGGNAADTLKGNNGQDTLKGNKGQDSLLGKHGADTLQGGDGADTLKGGNAADTLKGNGGADTLRGNDGNDTLKGNDGRDSLNGGGGGGDDCHGGGGNDRTPARGCETVRSVP